MQAVTKASRTEGWTDSLVTYKLAYIAYGLSHMSHLTALTN